MTTPHWWREKVMVYYYKKMVIFTSVTKCKQLFECSRNDCISLDYHVIFIHNRLALNFK